MRTCEYCKATLDATEPCDCLKARAARNVKATAKKEVVYIKTRNLNPHPRNPRQNVGDVGELAASIAESGIKQPLTVIPAISYITGSPTVIEYRADQEPDYTVIIGHRRLAAAKLAGLPEVPCFIEEMNELEQIATMLAENMQRSDLTPLEEAVGFQYCLDLGDSVSDIAQRTGKSEATVTRRLKLRSLDCDTVTKAYEQGVTLSELERVTKLKDAELRNEVLKKYGAKDWQYAIISAEQKERNAELKAENEAYFALLFDAVELAEGERVWERYAFAHTCKKDKNGDWELPGDVDAVDYYYLPSWDSVTLYTLKPPQTAQEQADAQAKAELEARVAKLGELAKVCYETRKAFVGKLNPKAEDVIPMITSLKSERNIYQSFKGNPDAPLAKQLTALLKYYLDDNAYGYYSYSGLHIENTRLDTIYDCLTQLGYVLSDDEQQLKDGTHEAYLEA